MSSTAKSKWWMYTILPAIMPAAVRTLVYFAAAEPKTGFSLNPGDLIAFGLVLNITNFNELEHVKVEDKAWKTQAGGISIAYLFVFAALFALFATHELQPGMFRIGFIGMIALLLALTSFGHSFAVQSRLARLGSISQTAETQ